MKYRKKPVVVEAIQWTGTNVVELMDFVGTDLTWIEGDPFVDTLEGDALTISFRDYVIRGIQGEFYPCKPDIFEDSYEKVEE
jgi:hypothetical protein